MRCWCVYVVGCQIMVGSANNVRYVGMIACDHSSYDNGIMIDCDTVYGYTAEIVRLLYLYLL